MNFFYKISIDHVNANYISGWCFNRFNKAETVELQCFAEKKLLATARADRYREDLESLGIHRTGRCGFEFVMESPPTASHNSYVIKEKRTGRALATIDLAENRAYYAHRMSKAFFTRIKKSWKNDKLIVFMHIPKSAGTSFNTLAQQLFGGHAVRTHIELLDTRKYRDFAKQYRYISGHLRFGTLNGHFNAEEHDFYTILREPYAQLHSHLKWLIQTSSDTNDTFFRHTNPAIYRLGEDLARIGEFSHEKLSQLVDRMEQIQAAFLDNAQTRYFLKESPLRVSNDDLERALNNASKFKLIGATEQYDAFIERFGQLNSISVPDKGTRMNLSKTGDLFDFHAHQVRKILKPLVQYDLKLYASVIGQDRSF